MSDSSSANETPTLLRPRTGRMLFGVCAALARRIGWDVSIVRTLFALMTLFSLGALVPVYLILWLALPAERDTQT